MSRDVLNYRTLTKRVIAHVETAEPYLVEALAHHSRGSRSSTSARRRRGSASRSPAPCATRVRWGSKSNGRRQTSREHDSPNDSPHAGLEHRPGAAHGRGPRCARRTARRRGGLALTKRPRSGAPGMPRFLNAAVRVTTALSPEDLKFEVIRPLERRLGRVRTADPNAPRTIDVDIAAVQGLVVDREDLRLPDPEILTRAHLAPPAGGCRAGLPASGAGDYAGRDRHPFSRRTRHLEARRCPVAVTSGWPYLPAPDSVSGPSNPRDSPRPVPGHECRPTRSDAGPPSDARSVGAGALIRPGDGRRRRRDHRHGHHHPADVFSPRTRTGTSSTALETGCTR